ncbi:MAG: hypothetical protein V1904_09660 [Bacteroidota bacterium]
MKKIFLFLALSFVATALAAQNVLLHKEVKDSLTVKFGPNLKNFRHFYIGIGFIAGEPDSAGSSIMQGYSMNYLIGYRYKLRLTNWFSLGYDIAFNSYSYRLKQDSTKITPNKTIHDKEKLTFGDLGVDCYLRFNYGRRGNRIGNFIDLGGYYDWVFSGRNYSKDKMTNGNVIETTISHLNYFNAYNYGALARLGFNRYVFYGYYRLSDIFDASYLYPELPRLTIGLQIGIHK